MKTMKKLTFFLLLFLTCSFGFSGSAQTFTKSADSLLVTFEIKNKKAVQVQPNTAKAKLFAQKNANDLLHTLDNFFPTDQYRKGKTVKIMQYRVNAKLWNDGAAADSFLSAVYILDITDALAYNERLKADTFLKVKSGPSKIPEQFYISVLDAQRLILVSVFSPLYTDEAAAKRRQEQVYSFLDWIQEQYR